MILKTNIPTEAQEQRAIVKWLSYHRILREFFCKNNNEGKRSPLGGHNLKLLGLRPGVSDLFIYYPTETYHGLWLEVKRDKNYSLSERSTPTWLAQEAFLKTVKSVGFAGETCYGCIAGINIIERYLLT